METMRTRIVSVAPGQGELISLQGIGVQFKIGGAESGGSVAVVEHPMDPRRLVPPHTHSREDELSYVLQGRVGVRIGDEITELGVGAYVLKPRGIKHTFWNPTDEPARLLEIITPAGFERYFAELPKLFARGFAPGGPEHQEFSREYGLELSGDWIAELKQRFGLKMLGER